MNKVLYVVGTLASGGIERLVCDWSLHLAKEKSWTPVIVCIIKMEGQFIQPLADAGILVEECSLRNGILQFIRKAAMLVRKHRPDVVHSQVAFSLLWQVLAYRWGGCKKIIFTQHNQYQNWNPFIAKQRLRIYFRFARPWINSYTCVSVPVRESLSTLLGVPPTEFPVIYNSIDLFRFKPAQRSEKSFRNEFGWGADDFVFISVARFAEQKGHQYLVEAFSGVVQEFPSAKLVLIGSGNLLPDIRSRTKALGIDSFVHFVERTDRVEEYLVNADAFVLASLWEGMPLSLLEAMACGVPAIATAVSGTTEVVNSENGTLVKPANVAELTKAMKNVLIDTANARAKAQVALLEITRRFSLPSIMSQYKSLYRA